MTEYLVEITPGREVVYRTHLALRTAMRSGEITPDSRIYHRAGSRWISITEHPEYRKFLTERRPPNWLEPIPFEPVAPPPPHERRRSRPGSVGAALRRARTSLRGWLARITATAEPPPRSTPTATEAEPERLRHSPPIESARPAPQPAPPPPTPPQPPEEGAGRSYTPPGGRRWTFYP